MSSYLFIGKPGSWKTEQFKIKIIPDLSKDILQAFFKEFRNSPKISYIGGKK